MSQNADEFFADEPPSLFDEDNYQTEPQTVDAPEFQTEEEEEVTPAMSGLCPSCLNTGFIHAFKGGVFGVVYTEVGQDSVGKPKKRLQVCGHNLNVGY